MPCVMLKIEAATAPCSQSHQVCAPYTHVHRHFNTGRGRSIHTNICVDYMEPSSSQFIQYLT